MPEPEAKTQIQVYVIMPFSKTTEKHSEDYWNEHYAHFITNRIMEVTAADAYLSGGYAWNIKRSSTVRGGPLNYEIVWDLMKAHIVIADLTDLNPNVLYELGIRHALCAALEMGRTIMILDETSWKLPFDFANYAVLKYHKDKVDTWKRDVGERLKTCIEAYHYKDNPVSMTFAQHTFSLKPQNTQDQAVEKVKGALDLLERMTTLGFDVKWLQHLIEESVLKKDGGADTSVSNPTT
jgi:hypothetical protein